MSASGLGKSGDDGKAEQAHGEDETGSEAMQHLLDRS